MALPMPLPMALPSLTEWAAAFDRLAPALLTAAAGSAVVLGLAGAAALVMRRGSAAARLAGASTGADTSRAVRWPAVDGLAAAVLGPRHPAGAVSGAAGSPELVVVAAALCRRRRGRVVRPARAAPRGGRRPPAGRA